MIEPLRDGRLCLSSVIELAKVITPANREEVLPRFFHLSRRQAAAVAVAIRPVEAAPQREVLTPVRAAPTLAHNATPPGTGTRTDTAKGAEAQPYLLRPAETALEPARCPHHHARRLLLHRRSATRPGRSRRRSRGCT
jgi:hypothetical protein